MVHTNFAVPSAVAVVTVTDCAAEPPVPVHVSVLLGCRGKPPRFSASRWRPKSRSSRLTSRRSSHFLRTTSRSRRRRPPTFWDWLSAALSAPVECEPLVASVPARDSAGARAEAHRREGRVCAISISSVPAKTLVILRRPYYRNRSPPRFARRPFTSTATTRTAEILLCRERRPSEPLRGDRGRPRRNQSGV
jgi:hypothetical protein